MPIINMIYKKQPIPHLATQGPCPDGFHVPTTTDVTNIKTILQGWGIFNSGAYRNYLKMPIAGSINEDGSRRNAGDNSVGRYWCSDVYSGYFGCIDFGKNYIYVPQGSYSCEGFSIRPQKDVAVNPLESEDTLKSGWSWTFHYGVNIGIVHNPTVGLISISGNGTTWYTIADKNLGATEAYEYGGAYTAANCGGYFQWGNNYMFPFSGSITTSSSQVNTTGYGPGNYYSSSTFITQSSRPFNWINPANNNLRGGVDGNVPVS